MIVLGFDTATSSTAVGLRLTDGETLCARDDAVPGERPGHTTRLLAIAHELLARADIGWNAVERIAVGVGPGTFTGLRVGVATARGLAQSLSVELVGVSSLHALAEAARADASGNDPADVLAVIDARRGEVFLGGYSPTDGATIEVMPPCALAPGELASALAAGTGRTRGEHRVEGRYVTEGECSTRERTWLAVGDGAVRYRADLRALGVAVPADASPLHQVDARAICELGARATPDRAREGGALERVLPDYLRRPDAEIALTARESQLESTGS